MDGRLAVWGLGAVFLLASCGVRELVDVNPQGSYPSGLNAVEPAFGNGGFESWYGETYPVSWRKAGFEAGYVTEFDTSANYFIAYSRSTDSYEGSNSLKIGWEADTYRNPTVYQSFTPLPGSNYVVSLYAKALSGTPRVALAFHWFNDNMGSAGFSSGTPVTVGTSWTHLVFTNRASWKSDLGYVMINANNTNSYCGTVLLDAATLSCYGGGLPPTLTNETTFIGPYAAITATNYDASFHGTTTVAELRAGATSGTVKGVVTGIQYKSTFYSFWMQDATGGIYVYKWGSGFSIDVNSIGKIVTFDVTGTQNYSGLMEITNGTGGSIADPVPANHEPTAIYVKDVAVSSDANQGLVVRYTSTVSLISSGYVYFDGTYPCLYFSSNPYISRFAADDTVTVVGPQSVYGSVPQIACQYAVFPTGMYYWGIHND